jgi:carboxymethylenebutenolidase
MKAVTRHIDIQTSDGVCDAFVARPAQGGPHPAVILLMDGFGPRDYLYEMAQKMAEPGYYVLLPNLLYRARRAPVLDVKFPLKKEDMPKVSPQLMPLIQGLTSEMSMKDAGALLDFLSGEKEAKPGKVALTGYCMGGAMALRTAARYPNRIAVAASFHGGRLATDAPDSPHVGLGSVQAELYIGHADKDASMPPEQIARLEEALKKSGVRYKAEVYAGAAHGYTMADLPAYNEAALKKHWEKLFALLKRAADNG